MTNALSNLGREDLDETKICENLKKKIAQLVLERHQPASENNNLKKEIVQLHKMKSFDVMQKLLYFS